MSSLLNGKFVRVLKRQKLGLWGLALRNRKTRQRLKKTIAYAQLSGKSYYYKYIKLLKIVKINTTESKVNGRTKF